MPGSTSPSAPGPNAPNSVPATRTRAPKAAAFTTTLMNAVMGVGEPL